MSVGVRHAARPIYPFSAIVGQRAMKRALLANAVCPSINGVLVRGQKGTAKSTAVRGLAAILPDIEVVAGCPFNCLPSGPLCPRCKALADKGAVLGPVRRRTRVLDLPLGATEDRVTGCLDLEAAVRDGVKALQPGILASAHRGVLYVDEVNLLSDHLVDAILDAAAMGLNTIEREGVSFVHASRFILVGTMNPEEGELRPQLLDRFGLCVEVGAPDEPRARCEVLRRRESFDADPRGFLDHWADRQEALARRVERARRDLGRTRLSEAMDRLCVELCLEALAAGLRADIAVRKTARALAALDGKSEVEEAQVREAAHMALAHRARQAPPRPESEPERDREHEPPEDRDPPRDPERPEEDRHSQGGHGRRPDQDQDPRPPDADQDRPSQGPGQGMESVFAAGEPFRVKPLDLKRDRRPRTGSGKRTRSRVRQKTGRYVKSRVSARPTDLALDATLRAAAPHQAARDKNGLAVNVEDQDLRQRIREKRLGHLIVFAVDASGSMGAGRRMVASKGAVLSLLLDAYQKRDKVALVAFRGDQGQVLLPPTGSIDLALKRLEELPTGGKTPLSHGLASAFEVLDTQLRRDPDVLPLLVLVSDGRANVSMGGGKPLAEALRMAEDIRADGRIQSLVVDVERPGLISLGLAKRMSASLGARYFKIDDLRARDLAVAVAEALA